MIRATSGAFRGWLQRLLVQRVYATCVYPIEQRLRTVPNPLRRRALERTTPPEMAPAAAALRRDGIVILPGYLSGARLAACQESFARTMRAVRDGPPAQEQPMPWRYAGIKYREYEYQVPGVGISHTYQPFRNDRALLDLALDEFLLGVIARYFNRKFKLCEANASRQYPAEPRDFSSWQWHHDGLGPRINIITYLTDVGPADQYMSYLKGSHRLRHGYGIHNGRTRFSGEQRAARFAAYPQVDCTGPAGTVLVFDSNGIHRGNRTLGATRDTLFASYCPGSTNWPVLVPKALAEGFSPLQSEVLFRNPRAQAI